MSDAARPGGLPLHRDGRPATGGAVLPEWHCCHGLPDHATLSDHCCERIPQPALDTPGTRPRDGAGKHSYSPPILLVVQTLTAALDRRLAAPTAARVEPRGVPPSTPLPRAGVTVLQI